jgi:hypothetical protein
VQVVLPAKRRLEAYPAIIALGGGPRRDTVDGVLNRSLRAEAEAPTCDCAGPPNGELFFEGGARIFPDFLALWPTTDSGRQVSHRRTVERRHRGLHVAAANPQYSSR